MSEGGTQIPLTVPPSGERRRTWLDLSARERESVRRLLTPEPGDSLDDLLTRMERALQVIRGVS